MSKTTKQIYDGKYSHAAGSWLSRIGRAWEIYLLVNGARYRKGANKHIVDVQTELAKQIKTKVPKIEGYVYDAETGEKLAPLYRVRGLVGLVIGCNDGEELFRFKPLVGPYLQLIGVDINGKAIANTITKIKDKRKNYSWETEIDGAYEASVENLRIKSGSIDAVFSRHTLEHVKRPSRALEEIIRVVRPATPVCITYPFELIRGITAVPSALVRYGNPFMARKIHLHKLDPGKVEAMVDKSYVAHMESRLMFTPMPVWMTIMVRNLKPYKTEDYVPGRQ